MCVAVMESEEELAVMKEVSSVEVKGDSVEKCLKGKRKGRAK